MEFNSIIAVKDLIKNYKNFTLNIPELKIPKGYATALIGENGAGKTTLLDILAGINLDYKGQITYFDQYSDKDRENNPVVKEAIGYTGTNNYYMQQWTMRQIKELMSLLFASFDEKKYEQIIQELALFPNGKIEQNKPVSALSDGNRVKLMLAGVLARDTKLLLLDEPASPLDPLMRDRLCELIRDYLAENEGEKSVLFSTHNVSDMENVTDYCIIVENGQVVEQGFVEDLKEKYIHVTGNAEDVEVAKKIL